MTFGKGAAKRAQRGWTERFEGRYRMKAFPTVNPMGGWVKSLVTSDFLTNHSRSLPFPFIARVLEQTTEYILWN